MFKSVNRISVFKYVTNDGLTFSHRTANWIKVIRRFSGEPAKKPKEQEPAEVILDVSFTTFMQQRQEQAKRSFIIKICSTKEESKILNFCSNHGSIRNAYCYESVNQYLLIEMSTECELKNILQRLCGKQKNLESLSQFLELKPSSFLKLKPAKHYVFPNLIRGSNDTSKAILNEELKKKDNCLSDCIRNFYDVLKVNDLEIRKKFLTCRQIEILCGGFIPNAVAFPFGSSVTGFGVNGCDLDISLLPIVNSANLTAQHHYCDFNSEAMRKHLECISELLRHFMPWCTNLYYIRRARVPIVKYKDLFTNVECDLSLYNPHGVAVSLMCYTIASFDWKIRALVIFFKLWAQKVGVVSRQPGIKISNFSLCMLVLFFLQQIKMTPPWSIFPCRDDQFLLKENAILSFCDLCDEKKKYSSVNMTVAELFKGFFEFYKDFNFSKWGISIKNATTIKNVDKYPLFIENPIYPGINISANVRPVDIAEIKEVMSDVLEILSEGSGQEQIQRLFGLSTKGRESFFSAL